MGFSSSLAELNTSTTCIGGTSQIDATLAAGTKSGYVYTYAPVGATPYLSYTLNVDPVTRGVTGQRSFWSSEIAVTRYRQNAAATNTDNAIQ